MGDEFILCAAIDYGGVIVPGHRHGDCHELLETLVDDIDIDKIPKRDNQGFLTSLNRYVGREEAWEIAKRNNQIKYGLKACENWHDIKINGIDIPSDQKPILISENLY